jgi:hypothetical protein
MNYGLSDQVRVLAEEKYVKPATAAGVTRFSVAARDLMQDLKGNGFPARNWPQICTSIQSEKFLRANGLEIEAVDGPPSRQSSTVVVHYRVVRSESTIDEPARTVVGPHLETRAETPEERAHRLTGKLFGLLKDELAEYGGGEAFMRWVRSDDEGSR